MAAGMGTVMKALKEYQGTGANTAIVGVTAALEAIINVAVYSCPCVEASELTTCSVYPNGTLVNRNCQPALLNYWYGISYLVGPAVILFIVSVAASPKIWKLWTGCLNEKENHRKVFSIFVIMEVFGRGMISPMSWVCFALLDGKYYACTVTPLPYDLLTAKIYKTCYDIAAKGIGKVPYGDQYNDNRSYSQMIGWFVIAGCCLIGFIAYACSECNFPLTYYHAKYYRIYREQEEAEFTDEMTTKAQKDAERNIRMFMEKPRDKNLWDKISTVFSFHRDKKKLSLYTYLDEWVREQKYKKENEAAKEALLQQSDEPINEGTLLLESQIPLPNGGDIEKGIDQKDNDQTFTKNSDQESSHPTALLLNDQFSPTFTQSNGSATPTEAVPMQLLTQA